MIRSCERNWCENVTGELCDNENVRPFCIIIWRLIKAPLESCSAQDYRRDLFINWRELLKRGIHLGRHCFSIVLFLLPYNSKIVLPSITAVRMTAGGSQACDLPYIIVHRVYRKILLQ